MAHAHHHHDEDLTAYFTEQLFTIGLCGALGAVTIALYSQNKLRFILADRFHLWVLLGGIALLALVVIRAIAVWNLAGKVKPAEALDHEHAHEHEHAHQHEHAHTHHDHDHSCGHDHAHEHQHTEALTAAATATAPSLTVVSTPPAPAPALAHDHNHDHGNCQHDHEHGHDHAPGPDHAHHHDHDHGWAPWRYVLLLLPVALFLLNLPNEVLSGEQKGLNKDDFNAPVEVAKKGEADFNIGFSELGLAALTPDTRESYAGKTVRLIGQYAGLDEKSFTLRRYKMNCCVADAVPLNAVILLDPRANSARLEPSKLKGKWVQVTGMVQFLNKKNTSEYMTALIVMPTAEEPLSKLVAVVGPPANPYAD